MLYTSMAFLFSSLLLVSRMISAAPLPGCVPSKESSNCTPEERYDRSRARMLSKGVHQRAANSALHDINEAQIALLSAAEGLVNFEVKPSERGVMANHGLSQAAPEGRRPLDVEKASIAYRAALNSVRQKLRKLQEEEEILGRDITTLQYGDQPEALAVLQLMKYYCVTSRDIASDLPHQGFDHIIGNMPLTPVEQGQMMAKIHSQRARLETIQQGLQELVNGQ